tara:strand:- start:81943 stop:82164 length:222 start_codon:yes stop_codon:yes gene_type:complete
MLEWPALCGLTHLIVSKNPLLFSVTQNINRIKTGITYLTLSGGWRYVNKDKSLISYVNDLLIEGSFFLDFGNS